MNLEVVEQKCLNYLKHASNPLVDVDVLYRHVAQEPGAGDISQADLLDFLRHHELFKVMEPVGLALDPETEQALGDAGLPAAPQVILCTRIPTQAELAQAIGQQLHRMQDALASALREAEENDDQQRAERISNAVQRMQLLERKLEAFL